MKFNNGQVECNGMRYKCNIKETKLLRTKTTKGVEKFIKPSAEVEMNDEDFAFLFLSRFHLFFMLGR